ncbi:lysylphosphatidylglycerol synthase transmembrane domain-containing protein [Phytohabitans aurantiacus]|uniref:Membrane protein n=1 Tax=Phytohabitans aurantiacus TaxID=3016789 RepID=A0ABQ5QPC6_9ACTN|nr:lysylphosphatidylglycerol synthase transmembrane domain-containing protein [Phytohabitans aurantiacus]GLH96503.1 membrane protein [Phytohabitans aurantiacus]
MSENQSWRRILLALLAPVAVVGYGVWKWPTVVSAGGALVDARLGWLVAGACAIALTYVAGAASQQGAVVPDLPRRRLFLAQLAGVSANAVLPAGIGSAVVAHGFLRRCGVSRAGAVAAVALNGFAGVVFHVVVLLALAATAPDRLPIHRPAFGPMWIVVGAAVVLAVAGALGWARASGRGRAIVRGIGRQWAAMREVLADRRRMALLCGGAAAVPLLHAMTLGAVLHAIGRPLPVVDVLIAYFAASAVTALVPSPGSVGGLDLMLGVTLAGVGADTQTAMAAVLGYRLLASWLPLLPSALALAHLRARSGAHPRGNLSDRIRVA